MFNFELGQMAYRTDTGVDFLITARKERHGCPEPEYCNPYGTWLKQSELKPKSSPPPFPGRGGWVCNPIDKAAINSLSRAVGLINNPASGIFSNRTSPSAPKTPKEAHNAAVKEVLTQRGDQYTPDPARSQIQSEMNDVVMAALKPLLPADMPLGSNFILTQMVAKLTRAIEGALNGGYEGDNGLDLSGYEACLAGKKLGVHPKEVVK